MGGGLMQLVAYGAQDIYLTGNPQITFFKVVYRRHTNFAVESIAQTFNGTADFGNKVSCVISRNGDLVGNMYLQVKLPKLQQTQGSATYVNWVNGIGNALVKTVDVEIGGQQIDKHYAEWLDIWGELNVSECQQQAYDSMVGNYNSSTGLKYSASYTNTLYVPLRFWFNRNPGLALPLIALQYHEVKINVDFRPVLELVNSDDTLSSVLEGDGSTAASISSCDLYVDYIYLDTDERRRFAQISHEYLIEQVQHTGNEAVTASTTSLKVDINYNHPVKALYWVFSDDTYTTANTSTGNNVLKYENSSVDSTTGRYDTFATLKVLLNGHDRFSARDSDYFRLVQNNQHSTCSPRKHVYTYSFALKPDEHQPSGTCNFSRIDNATMQFTLSSSQSTNAKTLKVYAVNYNVLRIMSGMGGLAYSN